MSDEHGFKSKMDFVQSKNAYPCGLCNRVHAPSGVLRLTDVKPDFPPDAPNVDILICENALEYGHFLMWAEAMDSTPEAQAHLENVESGTPDDMRGTASIDYSPDELMQLDREREEAERRFSAGLTD